MRPCRLVFRHREWQQLAGLTAGAYAAGRMRSNRQNDVEELLVERITPLFGCPCGSDFPAFAEWVCIASSEDINRLLWMIEPLERQRVAVLVLGLGEDTMGWTGRVVEGIRSTSLESVRVVGPSMPDTNREQETPQLLLSALTSRTRGALGTVTDAWLRRASVMCIGAGRNGSLAAQQFAALGVRRIVLIDFDTLEESNLNAMLGIDYRDVGQPKIHGLARSLRRSWPNLVVDTLACPATDPRVVDLARRVELIGTCVDERGESARLAAALLANRFLKLHLDVGTGITRDESGSRVLAGDARIFLPGEGCIACVGELVDLDTALQDVLYDRPHPESVAQWRNQRLGSLLTLNAMTVSIGIQMVLDLVGGRMQSSHWHRVRWVEGQGLQTDHGPVGGAVRCRICDGHR